MTRQYYELRRELRLLAVAHQDHYPLAADLSATRNQVVLAWLLRQNIDPIVGASRVEQIEEALAAREVPLTNTHMTRFEEAR